MSKVCFRPGAIGRWSRCSLCFAALAWSGCALMPGGRPGAVAAANPLPVQAGNEEVLWERTIDVLHQYHFRIERENRVARVIETEPRVGSGWLEPWHRDSVGVGNRLESSLQSIRRRVVVTMIPAESPGQFFVSVQALKEREDLQGLAANSPGAATFLESRPLDRDLDPVVGQSTPSDWIPLGRDLALEQSLVASLQAAYTR